MSWLSKQLKSAKKAVTHPASWIKGAGKTLGKTMDNPIVKGAGALALGATGVGAPLSAAIMAGNSLTSNALQGKSVPKALPKIGMDAAMSLALAKGGSMFKSAAGKVPLVNRLPFANSGIKLPANVDVGKIFSGLPTDAAGNIMTSSGGGSGNGSGIYGMLSGMMSRAADAKAGNKSLLGKAVSFGGNLIRGGGADGKGSFGAAGDLVGRLLGGGGGEGEGAGGMSLLDKLLMGGGVAVSAMDAKRNRDLENEAMDFSRDSYNSRAPIRARAMALLGDESKPDFSDIFADPGNAYSRPSLAPAAPMTAPTGTADKVRSITSGGGGLGGVMRRAQEVAAATPGATAGPRRLPSAAEPLMLPRMKDPALLAQLQ